jgi:hypothetical protein
MMDKNHVILLRAKDLDQLREAHKRNRVILISHQVTSITYLKIKLMVKISIYLDKRVRVKEDQVIGIRRRYLAVKDIEVIPRISHEINSLIEY